MTKDDALKLARDALKNLPGFLADVEAAIDACEEALAQPAHPLKAVLRDDTEHGKAYYLASDVDALLQHLTRAAEATADVAELQRLRAENAELRTINALLAAERERCAALADSMRMGMPGHTARHPVFLYRGDVGEMIRGA